MILKRGALAPLKHPIKLGSLSKGKEGEIIERGEALLLPRFPLPLLREGGQGDRLINSSIR
jgi:hypothetical protein